MPIEHIVVDGSNIATEGRSVPSLKQLEEAVAELRRDHPDAEVTVIVDATFAHRIDPSELPRYEEAELRGEYVHPPAGAIGRGDAFLLRVAEKVDGTVLSNDSFQEFHGEHPWLFERGRLLGGTPVPGIGWIFSPRQPVRGPRSRQAVRETTQAKKRVTKAIAVATKEVVEAREQPVGAAAPGDSSSGRRRGGSAPEKASGPPADGGRPTPLAVNDPLVFISFIAEHRLGEQLEGEVEGYSSHGAVVRVGDMRCYIPLANLADPAPRSAREVLKRKERGVFVLTALDPQRRGAELALPGIARVSGHPREETVAAEVRLARPPRKRAEAPRPRPAATRKLAVPSAATAPPRKVPVGKEPASKERATKAPATKEPATKEPATKEPATKEPATKQPAAKEPANRGPVVRAPAKKSAGGAAALDKAAASQAPAKTPPRRNVPPSKAPPRTVTASKAPPKEKQASTALPSKAVSDGEPPAKAVGRAARRPTVASESAPPGQPAHEPGPELTAAAEVVPGARRSPRTAARSRGAAPSTGNRRPSGG